MHHKKINRLLSLTLAAVLLLSGCKAYREAGKSYKEGLALFDEGKYEEAAPVLKQALLKEEGKDKLSKKEESLNKKAYYALGVAAFKQDDYEGANTYFKQALSIPYLETWDFDIRSYQLDALIKLKKYEEAYQTVLLLRKEEDQNFPLIFSEYFLLTALQKDQEAQALMNEALKVKGFGDDYKFYRAKAYYFLGNLKEAEAGMKEAADNKIAEASFYLGRIAEDQEDYEKALAYYAACQKQEETAGDFVAQKIAFCYEKLGDIKNALKAYEEGIAASDGSFLKELRFNQITLLEKDLQFEEAYDKCKSYVEDYKEDETMKREYEFLKSRVKK